MISTGRLKKVTSHKGFIVAVSRESEFYVFTADEWDYGYGYRSEEISCGSIKEALDFIDSY